MNKILLLVVIVGAAATAYFLLAKANIKFVDLKGEASPSYELSNNQQGEISVFATDIPQITDLEITPDGEWLLASRLTGEVEAISLTKSNKQTPVTAKISTSHPGFPPEEAGLTGIALGADFEKSHDIFFTYSYKEKGGEFKNKVARANLEKTGDGILAKNLKDIFTSNTEGSGSHQIQDGVGVNVSGTPHFLFTIGEGFKAQRALDPLAEAGKLMLIQSNGDSPLGVRPYPNSPKVQALGIRNAPAMAINNKEIVAIGDTGPSSDDRLIYGKFLAHDGKNDKTLSFNWDGSEESLKTQTQDPYNDSKNAIIHRWSPTQTPVSIEFLDDKTFLVILFGQTGSPLNSPGKTILKVTVGQNQNVAFETLVTRSKSAEGKLGHPIGLAKNPTNGDIYFADILEGYIYKLSLQKGGEEK